MNRSTVSVLILLFVASLAGCRSSKENVKETSDGTLQRMPAQPGPGISPGHCRIIGTIIAIDSLRTGGPDDACSKVPCTATVRVEKVLGYGSGFTEALGTGKEITVRFRYTLSPTSELFPQMAPPLPGLEVGAKFQTDLFLAGPSIAGSNESGFMAEHYERK